jgi:hypothetical protein
VRALQTDARVVLQTERGIMSAIWTKAFPKQVRPKIDRQQEYGKIRTKFLRENKACEICKDSAATDIHHKRGRAGALLCDTIYWMALCRSCHSFIHQNMEQARMAGWLCKKGEWNKQ